MNDEDEASYNVSLEHGHAIDVISDMIGLGCASTLEAVLRKLCATSIKYPTLGCTFLTLKWRGMRHRDFGGLYSNVRTMVQRGGGGVVVRTSPSGGGANHAIAAATACVVKGTQVVACINNRDPHYPQYAVTESVALSPPAVGATYIDHIVFDVDHNVGCEDEIPTLSKCHCSWQPTLQHPMRSPPCGWKLISIDTACLGSMGPMWRFQGSTLKVPLCFMAG